MKDRGNLRPAPSWITPDLVRRVVDLFDSAPGAPAPVALHPTPLVKPTLHLVASTAAPVERQSDTSETPRLTFAEACRAAKTSEAAAASDTNPATNDTPRAARPTFHLSIEEKAARFEADRAKSVLERKRERCRDARRLEREKGAEERARLKLARIAERPPRWFEEPQFLQAVEIAHRRGVAGCDLSRAVGRAQATVMAQTKRLGFAFGLRPPLADSITLAQLLAFAADSVPLPELRRDRLKRERLAREARDKKDKRARARAADANYRARTESYSARVAPRRADTARADHPLGAGHPITDLSQLDVRNKRRSDKVRRGVVARAEAMVDAGARPTRGTNVHVKIAMRAVEVQRAEDARLACPVEATKTLLRQKGRVVYSMSVHDGAPDLYFCSGLGKDVTADELAAYAERISA